MTNILKDKRYMFLAVLGLTLLASSAFATGTSTVTFSATTNTFVKGINTVLSLAGIGIATIAVFIFGYQVGFAGKSAAQAAPILIGGFLIGAAASIGSALVGNSDTGYSTGTIYYYPVDGGINVATMSIGGALVDGASHYLVIS
jgi:type IV secretion system protein VirB2